MVKYQGSILHSHKGTRLTQNVNNREGERCVRGAGEVSMLPVLCVLQILPVYKLFSKLQSLLKNKRREQRTTKTTGVRVRSVRNELSDERTQKSTEARVNAAGAGGPQRR